jgi:transcriptional regulator with XRE-family HTH domain
MGAGRKKSSPNEERVRQKLVAALITAIPDKWGALSRAAKETGISKQSLSLYRQGKAVPTPETLQRLCAKLKLHLEVEGVIISGSVLPARQREQKKAIQLPLALTEAISAVDAQNLQIQVLKRRSESIDLKVTIAFTVPEKGPKRSSRQTMAAAS